ncbi:MAG: Asp-tRNA(Asn)/Glu-tRNA(Gln) amidotransferase subunit GatC [Tissierellia bacterium]|nr:Asp-tRNA(Asn)/Glu-tRNA(Gln) amidotransferase subunit GatC [Tissierellia bacterium]
MDYNKIRHIGNIVRLEISDEDIDEVASRFEETMDFISKIGDVDTEGIDPAIACTSREHSFRDDKLLSSLPVEDVLLNTASRKYGYFSVIKFVE